MAHHIVELSARIQWVLDTGGLSMVELAMWLGRPRPTVRTWLYDGRTPMRHVRIETERRLTVLEKLIKKRQPHRLFSPRANAQQRQSYMKRLIHVHLKEVP